MPEQSAPGQDRRWATRALGPRLRPVADYGALGPNSKFAKLVSPAAAATNCSDSRRLPRSLRLLHFAAMMVGTGAALLFSCGTAGAAWGKITGMFSVQTHSPASPAGFSEHDLDGQKPQKQAEILLERAIDHSAGATNQSEPEIEARVDGWRGKLQWDSQLGDLTTVALNSTDQSVRASAIEVQLAAYGLPKSESSVDALVRQADASDHGRMVWALWALGLLGNRGVETDHVVEVLTKHLKDSAEDARRRAVEGLALVGATSTIAPLLDAMRNDPSAIVREHAASSLAGSGMLSRQQRLAAVPQLIDYSDDPALDAQTRAWAFEALSKITTQRLPNNSVAWRNWYRTRSPEH
ncbi:MAG: HEAT repeat domain-containing protein [Candidatus Sulfotelmatobacter sp.]